MTENGVAAAAPDDDRTPTQSDVPVTKPADEWVMPEPVFRRSEGYTPNAAARGNEDETLMPDTLEPRDFAGDEAAAEEEIAQQPDLSEELVSEAAASPAPPAVTVKKKKSGLVKVLLILLGVVLALAVAAVAMIALGLGYLFRISESQNLN